MILIILVYLLIIILLLRSNPKPVPKTKFIRPRSANHPGSVSAETRDLLYRMCLGDIDLAHRMVNLEWADTQEQRWKKAIYRLERDRS